MAEAASPSSHSSFYEEVFSFRIRGTNEVDRTNILAPGVCSGIYRNHLLPAFTPEFFRELAQWEVVSSYSSATAPDSHGISCADPLFQARKELHPGVAACALPFKIYLSIPQLIFPCVFDCFFSQSGDHRRSRLHRLQSYVHFAGKISERASHGD